MFAADLKLFHLDLKISQSAFRETAETFGRSTGGGLEDPPELPGV